MKKIYFFLFFLLMSYKTTVIAQDKITVGVYSSWKHTETSISNIPWDQFSHIAIAAAYPTPDGSLNTDLIDVFIDELVSSAHKNNRKVVLSVGGAGKASKAFLSIASSPDIRSSFIDNLLLYVKNHQIDGIDIDWEYWTYQSELDKGGNDPVESQYLVDLLSNLRTRTIGKLMLSVDIAPGPWMGPQYRVELQEHVDYVNLMAFDFTGGWKSSSIKHHSDYRTFVKAIKHTLDRGFHKEKLLIGLPTYGIEFIDGKNKETKHIEHREIVDIAKRNYKVLNKGKIGNLYFETRKNIERKAKYISEQNLRGFFVFDIQSDHTAREFNLIESTKKYITPEISTKNNAEASTIPPLP